MDHSKNCLNAFEPHERNLISTPSQGSIEDLTPMADFMFRLTKKEKDELVTNCDRFQPLKHSSVSPRAFTEQGVAMLSSVLHSPRAIEVNITIMRAFVHLRKMIASHKELAKKLKELEHHIKDHDEQIQAIFEAIQQLITLPEDSKKKIGFTTKEAQKSYAKKRTKN